MKYTEKSEKNNCDDEIDWSKQYETVEKIGVKGYSQRYFEECKYIWRNMVPKSGQSDNLQGEMLRMSVKLRNEAFNNGNRNWDNNFQWFCTFLKETLVECGLFDDEKLIKIKMVLEYIEDNGNYALKYNNGEIDDNEVDIFRLAYTDEDIYEYLEDAIAEYYLNNRAPVPYKSKDFIFR